MDITPASAVQVMDSGDLVEIGDDVLGVARQLREIDPSLKLRYSERHEFWAVYQEDRHPITGELLRKQLVTTMKGELLSGPLLERIRKVTSDGYDLAKEVETVERQRKRDLDHQRREERGPALERLAHAIRKDKGLDKLRIAVPKSLVLPPGIAA